MSAMSEAASRQIHSNLKSEPKCMQPQGRKHSCCHAATIKCCQHYMMLMEINGRSPRHFLHFLAVRIVREDHDRRMGRLLEDLVLGIACVVSLLR